MKKQKETTEYGSVKFSRLIKETRRLIAIICFSLLFFACSSATDFSDESKNTAGITKITQAGKSDVGEFPIFHNYAEKMADIILASQISEGGVANRVIRPNPQRPTFMTTYSFAGIALVKAFQMTGNQQYLEGAKKFVDFWMARQNLTPDRWGLVGTFYDRIKKDDGTIDYFIYSEETSSNLANRGGPGYDASDSDGPMVSLAAYHYYLLTGDIEMLRKYRNGFKLIGDSIIATLDFEDHLTYCHPNYKTKYLMDVSEVWMQLEALSGIFRVLAQNNPDAEPVNGNQISYKMFDDKVLSSNYASLADRSRKSINEGWFNQSEGWYYWTKDVHGQQQSCNWEKVYPDTQEQLWPLLWAVADPKSKQAVTIWENFNKNWPRWAYEDVRWPSNSNIAIKMGDYERAIIQITNVFENQRYKRWGTNNMYYAIRNCCLDFDVSGNAHVVQGSMQNAASVFKVKLRSIGGGTGTITLRLPNPGKDVVSINGQQCETTNVAGRNVLKTTFQREETKEISVKFTEK